jgi:transglutaminase-like putative cysteine protease
MEFSVSAGLVYEAKSTGTLVLNIRALQVISENLIIDPGNVTYIDHASENNRLLALNIETPGEISINYQAKAHNPYNTIDTSVLPPLSLAQLPPYIFVYLNASRYCQSDRMSRMAMQLFGDLKDDFTKVIHITEWIYKHVEYLSGSTNANTSAYDTIIQQAGVCRDFAHVGIAFCRALSIPARYCSVYAYNLQLPDFHACFEAYISGHWIIFDATRLAPLNGFVKIAVGTDAADAALATLFGEVNGQSLQADCLLSAGTLEPVFYSVDSAIGISYV